MKTIIYTDGSSRGNPGSGGWGAIVISDKEVRELGGYDGETTNNRMELKGVIEAIKNVETGNSIIVYSDSEYVIKGITVWIHNWQKKGWKNSQKKAVLNRDLWEDLLEVTKGKKIEWKYVKGHDDNPGNERCDVIATQFADREKLSLYKGEKTKYPFTDILKSVL